MLRYIQCFFSSVLAFLSPIIGRTELNLFMHLRGSVLAVWGITEDCNMSLYPATWLDIVRPTGFEILLGSLTLAVLAILRGRNIIQQLGMTQT
jgi:hypothetical protein